MKALLTITAVLEAATGLALLGAPNAAVDDPKGPDAPYDPVEPTERKHVHRGGSFLCTDQYCTRHMVGTRGKGEESTGSNHVGFRCVKDAPSTPAP